MPEAARVDHVNSGNSPAEKGSPNVFIGKKQVLRVKDSFKDGGQIESGAPHVTINGKAAARKGDKVTGGGTVKQGCPRVRIGKCGGPGHGFEAFRRELAARGTEKDKLLLCLSDIAGAEAERAGNPEDRDGWLYLQRMFPKWFFGPANANAKANPDFFSIEWAWTQQFAWAFNAYYMFTFYGNRTEQNNIYNRAAQKRLGEILRGDPGKLDPEKSVPFDYTKLPPLERIKFSFNFRTVPFNVIPPKNGLLAALAGYTLYALGRGHTRPSGYAKHTITLTGATVFVHDQFDFKPDENFRYWSCEKQEFSPWPGTGWTQITGADFLAFRDKHRFGNDFQVFSDSHEVENFQEQRYDYP